MAIPRVIPVLLLKNAGLVKTVQFKDPKYVGDPLNAVRIFNEKEVDELIFLDILSTPELRPIPLEFLKEVAEECFMPLAYGGGIKTLEDIRAILKIGIEKVIINSQLYKDLDFLREAVNQFGSSTIAVSLDVKKNFWGKYELFSEGGKTNTKKDPIEFAKELDNIGVGEIMINSIDRDGTMKGYDLDLITKMCAAVQIPVIACGGAATIDDFDKAINQAGASAVAAGSMFVFHGKHRAVLITYPEQSELKRIFSKKDH
ncbi:AglZ/HisF2 family acetamidino modification protein [Fluviicola sp.]|uniref:AglZ/HisF2 family acetamidino modification protein n=1 Tax=Fluviicola sp. TaxID=1917219 RepID=UPI003D2B3663